MVVDTFCWNIRGFNSRIKRRSIRKWLKSNKPLFGSDIETRVKIHKSRKYIKSFFAEWNFAGNYEYVLYDIYLIHILNGYPKPNQN